MASWPKHFFWQLNRSIRSLNRLIVDLTYITCINQLPFDLQVKSSCNVCLSSKLGYYGQNCTSKYSFPFNGYACTSQCNCSASDCDYVSGCRQLSTLKLMSASTGNPSSTSAGIQTYRWGFYFLFLPFVSCLINASRV